MNLLTTWILNNKLASLLGVALIALSIFCGFQYLEIKVLKARLTVAEENLKARTAALRTLETEAEILRGKIKKSEGRIKAERKKYERRLKEIRDVPVPQDCEEAVSWGVDEFNSLLEDY